MTHPNRIICRYPSLVSVDSFVYAIEGDGTNDDNKVWSTFRLSQSGQYVAYIKYYGADDGGGINISFETHNPSLGEWYPITLNDGTLLTLSLDTTEATLDDPVLFRIPIRNENPNLYIPPTEDVLRIGMWADEGTVKGDVVVNVINAIRPSEPPYLVEGARDKKTKRLSVSFDENTANTWQIFHRDAQPSGGIEPGVGIGTQLIMIDEDPSQLYWADVPETGATSIMVGLDDLEGL